MIALWNWLKGKKTYIVAGVAVAYAAVEYWNGSMTQDQALAAIAIATGFGTVRHGIANQ